MLEINFLTEALVIFTSALADLQQDGISFSAPFLFEKLCGISLAVQYQRWQNQTYESFSQTTDVFVEIFDFLLQGKHEATMHEERSRAAIHRED